ncbi:MAG: serine/threonine-protein kinase [Myxococcales bacterium]
MQNARLASEHEPLRRGDGIADDFTGTSDGRYRVLGFLGSGGMGSVYEVEHTRLRRSFALKLLRADLAKNELVSQRFEREAQALASLESDYIVSIVDSGLLSDARPYFVMERLQGEDLRQLLRKLPVLPVARAVNLAIDVCLGLHVTHAHGLVHRDLKPENLFVTAVDGGRERCTLLDFGVAKLADTDQTQPGALIGTARYMAPEQVAHDGALGPRADVFALGVILHRCLSGKHPFEADSLERVLYKIMNSEPPPIDRAAVPRELESVILRALNKQAELRPDSALAFARELLPFANTIRELGPSTPWRVDLAAIPRVGDGEPTPSAGLTGLTGTAALAATEPRAMERRGRHWLGPAIACAGVVAAACWGAFSMRTPERSPAPKLAVQARNAPTPVATAVVAPSALPAPAPAPATAKDPDAATPPLDSATISARPAGLRRPAHPAKSAPVDSVPRSPNWFDPRNPYGK